MKRAEDADMEDEPRSQQDRVDEELFLDHMADGGAARALATVSRRNLREFARAVLRAAEARDTTPHYRRVRSFMSDLHVGRNAARLAAGAPLLPDTPAVPSDPGPALRLLRARLLQEETMETIDGLGVQVRIDPTNIGAVIGFDDLRFVDRGTFDPVAVADGCADVSVVAIGTLIECGIKDAPVLRLVDDNNSAKNGPGSRFVGDKLQKPPGHKPPDIAAEIARQKASA